MARRSTKLNMSVLLKVSDLFKSKNWSFDPNAPNLNLYHRFCARLSVFEGDEQLLLLELSEKFEQIPLTRYIEQFWIAYRRIPKAKLKDCDKIIIMPLLDFQSQQKGRKRIKSSEALYYNLSAENHDGIPFNERFRFLADSEEFKGVCGEDSILILIDDFIGSGETACAAINSYRTMKTGLKVLVVALVAQEQGVRKVKEETGCEVFSSKVFRRGISDSYQNEIVDEKIKLMRNMEAKISTAIEKKGLSLGYAQSEALICMINKSPNNTFPVFWYETETKASPFPRYKNYKGG